MTGLLIIGLLSCHADLFWALCRFKLVHYEVKGNNESHVFVKLHCVPVLRLNIKLLVC